MTRASLRCLSLPAAALVLGLAPGRASAQTTAPRFEVSGGGLFVGGYSLGSKDANLVSNQTGRAPYTLFKSDTDVGSTFGIEARAGVALSRMFVVEGGIFAARPRMRTRLRSDVESAPDTTATEDLQMYIIDGAIVARFGSSPRVRPFARAGFGYVRELHNGNVLVETGSALHAGGGVTIWFSEGRSRWGARADARVYVVRDGIAFGEKTRTLGAGGVSVVFGF